MRFTIGWFSQAVQSRSGLGRPAYKTRCDDVLGAMMSEPLGPRRSKIGRAERLCQLLAAVAVIWAVVEVVRWCCDPPALDVARQAVGEGHWDTAVKCYLVHLADNPRDWSARLELSVPLSQIDPTQVPAELRKVPPDADEYVEANRVIASTCLACQRFKHAKEPLLVLEAATPDDWWVHLSLAEVFARTDELSLALHHARRSAELNSEHTRTYVLMAELFDQLSRSAEIVGPLLKVIDLESENYAAHLNLCHAYVEAGQAGNARREAEWCLTRNPSDVNARRLLATAARDEGKRVEAMEEIQKALKLSPDDLNSRLLEAELLLFDRKADEAFGRLKPLYEQHKDNRRLAALLARSATTIGQLEEAGEYRKQVQKLSGQ